MSGVRSPLRPLVGPLGVAGLVAAGALAFPASTAFAGSDAAKRDEDTSDVVLAEDDDDDDDDDTNAKASNSGDNTNTGGGTNTGASKSTNDGTRSNFTPVSRDNDLSRSDKTKDFTKDGPGGKKRDWSQNKTNDASRNDTRG